MSWCRCSQRHTFCCRVGSRICGGEAPRKGIVSDVTYVLMYLCSHDSMFAVHACLCPAHMLSCEHMHTHRLRSCFAVNIVVAVGPCWTRAGRHCVFACCTCGTRAERHRVVIAQTTHGSIRNNSQRCRAVGGAATSTSKSDPATIATRKGTCWRSARCSLTSP